MYSPTSGANTGTTCKICSAGQYADKVGLATCKLCKPGRYLKIDQNDHSASDHLSEEKCKVCRENEYQPLDGQKICEDCPSGTVIEDSKTPSKHLSKDACYEKGLVAPCDAGQGRLAASGECIDCQTGKYPSNSKCVLCPRGYFQDQKRQEKCLKCLENSGACQSLPGMTTKDSSASFYPANLQAATATSVPAPTETENFEAYQNVTMGSSSEGPSDDDSLIVYVLLLTLSTITLGIHRFFCKDCLEADVMFARSDLLDPGKPVRDVPSKLGAAFTFVALLLFIGMIFQQAGELNETTSRGLNTYTKKLFEELSASEIGLDFGQVTMNVLLFGNNDKCTLAELGVDRVNVPMNCEAIAGVQDGTCSVSWSCKI